MKRVVSTYPIPDSNIKHHHSKSEKELEDAPPKPRKCQTLVTLRRKTKMISKLKNNQIKSQRSKLRLFGSPWRVERKIGD